ncbi:MAG: SDR family NAD(P)-dependent oxidoreductase [Clostridiales bacterium]|nr:SDR family NAD(P)-dependent oxidoreductase [Clostridiales bacterium]
MRTKIIITGATSGIGLGTLKALANAQYEIILGCRNLQKTETIVQEITASNKQALIHIYHLDLASFESIRRFSDSIHRDFDSIDILFNNAGLFSDTKKETKQGFEMTVGVNYIGTYLLTMLLRDLVQKGINPQVINVCSRAALFGHISFKNGEFIKRKHGFLAYSASKYMQLLSTIYLAKRYDDMGIVFSAIHPGDVATNIWNGESFIMRTIGPLMQKNLLTLDEGIIAGIHLIENRPDVSGGFYQMHGEEIEFKKYDTNKAEVLIKKTNEVIQEHGFEF